MPPTPSFCSVFCPACGEEYPVYADGPAVWGFCGRRCYSFFDTGLGYWRVTVAGQVFEFSAGREPLSVIEARQASVKEAIERVMVRLREKVHWAAEGF